MHTVSASTIGTALNLQLQRLSTTKLFQYINPYNLNMYRY